MVGSSVAMVSPKLTGCFCLCSLQERIWRFQSDPLPCHLLYPFSFCTIHNKVCVASNLSASDFSSEKTCRIFKLKYQYLSCLVFNLFSIDPVLEQRCLKAKMLLRSQRSHSGNHTETHSAFIEFHNTAYSLTAGLQTATVAILATLHSITTTCQYQICKETPRANFKIRFMARNVPRRNLKCT